MAMSMPNIHDLRMDDSTQQQQLSQAIKLYRVSVPKSEAVPPTAAEFCEKYSGGAPEKLQKKLTLLMEANIYTKIREEMDDAGRIRLDSCAGKGASHFITSHPRNGTKLFTLRDQAAVAAWRFRCGLHQHRRYIGRVCQTCGDAMDYDHFWICEKTRGGSVTDRHNQVLQVLREYIIKARMWCHIEPRIWTPEEREGKNVRPDAQCGGRDGKIYHIDVSVIHPPSPSYLPEGEYAKDVEKRKRNKHEADAIALGREFIPFVLETFGTWGDDAIKFIRMLGENYSDDEDVADAFNNDAIAAISFALQVGNAFVAGVGGFAYSKRNAERQQRADSGAPVRPPVVVHVAPHSLRNDRRRALAGRMRAPSVVVASGGLTITSSIGDGDRSVTSAIPSSVPVGDDRA
jgi:hypothetical protein